MKQPDIVYHGLGYVGLTGAVHFARRGLNVLGYDPDPVVVAALNEGKPKAGEFLGYINNPSDHDAGFPRATDDFEDTLDCRVHVIAVPTERAGEPDDELVLSVIDRIYTHGPADVLIIVESTLAPGTIDRWIDSRDPELGPGEAALAVCPRRDWFADPDKNVATLPRVVGGVTESCTKRAVEILRNVSHTILETDYRTAEITKPLENALLHTQIMLVHELALALPDHDVAKAVELAGTHWRLPALHLNFGSGGRCVPLGSKYLHEVSKGNLLSHALITDQVVRVQVADLANRLAAGKPQMVLGVAYRPGFKDAGLSPGLGVAKRLENGSVNDPLWTPAELERLAGMPSRPVEAIKNCRVVLLATPHEQYADLPLQPDLWSPGQIVIDAQGGWSQHEETFRANRVEYRQVGRPGWMK